VGSDKSSECSLYRLGILKIFWIRWEGLASPEVISGWGEGMPWDDEDTCRRMNLLRRLLIGVGCARTRPRPRRRGRRGGDSSSHFEKGTER